MKTFYQLERNRRRALRRWSGFRNAAVYGYRGLVWWIPRYCLVKGRFTRTVLNRFIDNMIEYRQKGGRK